MVKKTLQSLHFTYSFIFKLEGNVAMYDIHGNEIRNFPLSNSSNVDIRLLECHFWGNVVVAIDSNMDLYVAEGFSSTDLLSNLRKYVLKTHLEQWYQV